MTQSVALASAPADAPLPCFPTTASDRACALLRAAGVLSPHIQAGRPVNAAILRGAMVAAFGASDAEGAWGWKDAYQACEAAQLLFLRKFGPAMRARAGSPSVLVAMLAKVASLLPSQTRRSEESQALQQFSTPVALGFAVAQAAAIGNGDLVLEPSAGTGLLAAFAEMAGAGLVLNELGETRAELLGLLFPNAAVTRFDAAHIHDHLDASVRPTIVLTNPPFSASANVEGRVADTAVRHIGSALTRLTEGGRLVAITGSSLSPDNPSWRDVFVRLQERGRIVFTAAVDGRVYARHGTTTETRLTVIDRVPADDPALLKASIGLAPDVATLLAWVGTHVPRRAVLPPTRACIAPALCAAASPPPQTGPDRPSSSRTGTRTRSQRRCFTATSSNSPSATASRRRGRTARATGRPRSRRSGCRSPASAARARPAKRTSERSRRRTRAPSRRLGSAVSAGGRRSPARSTRSSTRTSAGSNAA